jgi:hypothetical protein
VPWRNYDLDVATKLVAAYNGGLAVEVTLHGVGRLPELVGVAHLDEHEGWADLYVADELGRDVTARVPLDDIASVTATDQSWR